MKNECGAECVLLFRGKKETHSEDRLLCGSELLVIRQTHCSLSKEHGGGKPEIWTGTLAYTKTLKVSLPQQARKAKSQRGFLYVRGKRTFFDPDENNEWEENKRG